ncbi:MAG: MauE/DoxX family redox-associated membrane protein [Verrucomicrobiota bacterium JB025]|nr:DoxX family membrane protein [Verrucomicrobiota bacterium JB025]
MPTHSCRWPGAVIEAVLRVCLGTWFVFSGGMKVFGTGLDKFVYQISNYKLVGEPWDAVAAYTVPWFEMVVGVCLVVGVLKKGAYLTLAGMVAVFAFAIGWAWAHDMDIACGCHGGDERISYWGKVAEFAVYYAVIGWLWWWESRGSDGVNGEKTQNMA